MEECAGGAGERARRVAAFWARTSAGSTAAEALRNTVDLARAAERAGYRRYWPAEHHLNPGVAAASPPRCCSTAADTHGWTLGADDGPGISIAVAPNLWAGVGLVRGGAGTALVGSHTEVADRIAEHHALGIDEFVLSGYPHLEEAWWLPPSGRARRARPLRAVERMIVR